MCKVLDTGFDVHHICQRKSRSRLTVVDTHTRGGEVSATDHVSCERVGDTVLQ